MNFRKNEHGQVMVLTALSMTILFGFIAFAIDVGLLFNAKRKLQNAVDAAATSAAIDYMFNSSTTTATTAAGNAVTANGVHDAAVTVNFHPNITSPYHNSIYYVEVIAIQPNSTFFMSMFNQSLVNIGARAVAGMPGQGNACVIVLDPHASGAMTLQGSFNVSADKCGVVVDSDASDALQFTGGAGTLTAGYVSVVGGDGGQTGDSTPAPITGAAPVLNPFPSLSGPIPSQDCTSANTNTGKSYTGTSTLKTANNITCFSYSNVSLSNFTSSNPLPSGILVFENGVALGGTIYSGAAGTTFDNYSGTFAVNTGSTLNIVAPTSAISSPSGDSTAWTVPYGIALMQPASNSTQITVQFGASYGTWEGIIYAPSAMLYLQDSGGDINGGVTLTTDLIVGKLYDKTAILTIHSYTTAFGSSSPLTAVALVE
jgi:Putative Flp pilus-assembly TadE/G-like